MSSTPPILEPPTYDEPQYEDILIGTITEIIRDFLTRIDRDDLYEEEFEWTLNLTHNLQYHILLRINRVQNQ